MENSKLLKYSVLHSMGVLIYVSLVALLMTYGEQIFGKMSNIWGPIAFLLPFVLSALIVGMLVLGKPLMFYLDGKKKEAIQLLLYTIFWLFIFNILVFIILIFL